MKYLKLFQKEVDYQTFVESNKFVTPNVSFAQDENLVFYNPIENIDESNNIIIYTASEKLTELGDDAGWSDSGLRVNAFNSPIVSHEFANGVGTITFEEDVTYIGYEAFSYCGSLTSIVIPDSVTDIRDYSFQGCRSLTSITIPDSVTFIGEYAFDCCYDLTSVTLSSNLRGGIYAGTFQYCRSLTSIVIPDSVTSIGNEAFNGCSGLTSIIIPDSVAEIRWSAFQNCSSLTSVTIGSGVTEIGEWAFAGCSSLTAIYFNNTMDVWNSITLGEDWNDNSAIERIICTDGVIDLNSFNMVDRIDISYPELSGKVGEEMFNMFSIYGVDGNILDTFNFVEDTEEVLDNTSYGYLIQYDNNAFDNVFSYTKGGFIGMYLTPQTPGTHYITILARPSSKGGYITNSFKIVVTE